MAKWVADAVIDAALDKIATANIQTVCSAQPATRTEAIATYALADVVLTPGDGNGDFVVADAAGGGRKVTIAEQTGVTVDATGVGNHVALCDGTELLYVTETGEVRGGTAQAGGASTITLDTGASAVDQFYTAMAVRIVSGTGIGQTRIISGYVGSTKVATVSEAWTIAPASDSVFTIFGHALTAANTMTFGSWSAIIGDPA